MLVFGKLKYTTDSDKMIIVANLQVANMLKIKRFNLKKLGKLLLADRKKPIRIQKAHHQDLPKALHEIEQDYQNRRYRGW